MSQNTRLVYTTDRSRMCPSCLKPVALCNCKRDKSSPPNDAPVDGIVRVGRETKGRKGKSVTTISGLPGGEADLKALAAGIKRSCGSGGTVKDGMVIIQGDHVAALIAELNRQGYRTKKVGG